LKLTRKDVVTVAGSVIVRQRPETANGVLFITLEDETGLANIIVLPDIFERFRTVIIQSNFLLIKGVAESETMIKGLYFEPIKDFVAKVHSHDYH
jgi:error-prone DNA polymerase